MAAPLPIFGGGLNDSQRRRVTYIRISLTDRCNYRCTYCMPEEGVDLVPRGDVLTLEEIVRVVRLLTHAGVRRVRLTGGEPTARNGLVDLVDQLTALGLEDLAMTTNGHALRELAGPLKRAGLHRLNVSVDSLDTAKFRTITRWGDLARVLEGVEVAQSVGFVGTKLNTVALAGFNDGEIPAIAEWAWARDITPRFIEWMPMSAGELFAPGSFLPAAAIRARLIDRFGPAQIDDSHGLPGVGPARYLRFGTDRSIGRRAGIISAVSEPFCETCNRVRLSATGQLHTCLARDEVIDLRTSLRAGASEETILRLVRDGLAAKVEGHSFTLAGCGGPRKHMVTIGG